MRHSKNGSMHLSYAYTLAVGGIALLLGSACGPAHSPHSDHIDPHSISHLAESHIKELPRTLTPSRVSNFNRTHHQAFAKLFGGPSGQDVQSFIRSRIKYILNIFNNQNTYHISPPPKHRDWNKKPYSLISAPTQNSLENNFTHHNLGQSNLSHLATPIAVHDESTQNIGALNLSIDFWLQGLIDQTEYTLILPNGYRIRMNNPREAVVSVGPAYAMSANNTPTPTIISQSMLVHEARHSDCSGGISHRDLLMMKSSQNYLEFSQNSQSKKCGYLHDLCPSTHALAGQAACDTMPWGAYTAGIIFLEGALFRTDPYHFGKAVKSNLEWQLAQTYLLEFKTRLLFNYRHMIEGRLGDPDLSSSGLRH